MTGPGTSQNVTTASPASCGKCREVEPKGRECRLHDHLEEFNLRVLPDAELYRRTRVKSSLQSPPSLILRLEHVLMETMEVFTKLAGGTVCFQFPRREGKGKLIPEGRIS